MKIKQREPGEKSYAFVIEATISLSVEVEAKSLQEAVEKAQNAGFMTFCHQCSGGKPGEWAMSELSCDDPSACNLVDTFIDGKSPDEDEADALEKLWRDT